MRGTLCRLLVVACIGSMIGAAYGADQVDNPQYLSWSKAKPGTTVTLKTTSEMTMQGMPNPMKSESTMTGKLVSITPDEATVETSGKSTAMGQETAIPASTQKIPAKVDKGKDSATPANATDVKDGTDKVTIGGKTYDAKTKEFTVDQNGTKTTTKVWTSDEVPGGLLKMESNGAGTMTMTTKMELVEIKEP